MKTTGNITGLSMDPFTRKYQLTFRINENVDVINHYDDLKDTEVLDIAIEPHSEKRSLNANAYFHVLVGKLADKLKVSKTEMKNSLICDYGQRLFIDGSEARIASTVPHNALMHYMHCIPSTFDLQPDGDQTAYDIYRGSHTYTSKEMAALIDGTVTEAKEQGIETLTPEQLERMVNAWRPRKEAPSQTI